MNNHIITIIIHSSSSSSFQIIIWKRLRLSLAAFVSDLSDNSFPINNLNLGKTNQIHFMFLHHSKSKLVCLCLFLCLLQVMSSMEQARYWCHMCSQTVDPITDSEAMICPVCGSGFLEEEISESNDRALSLWAPILLSMMANPIRPRPLMETEADDGSQLTTRRRSRNSAAILQFLQSIRAGMLADHHNREREAQAQRVILINPFNQTIVLQGDRPPFASLGDYFIGPGLDLLLQHLSENDPNRYGTLPAQKEVIDALPSVTIHEPMQCAVCLDDCDEGDHLKEMPCKHKFHEMCIGPWLDLHSSCPVCRYQLPADDSKLVSDNSTPDNRISDNGRRFSVPLFWPFTALVQSHDAPTPPSATEDHEN